MANEEKMPTKKKQQMLWPLVIVLAALIFAFWAYNLKNVWRTSSSNVDLGSVKEEINQSLGELEEKLEENSRLQDDAGEMLNELIEEVEENASSSENFLPTTPDQATTTLDIPATTTTPSRNINCPEWINCMPTIGDEPRPCQIPVGCEGITQIAY